MNKKEHKVKLRRKIRIRKNIFGTSDKPRLSVFRSLKQIYAQVIDDATGKTIVSASSLSKEIADEIKNAKTKAEKSAIVGKLVAKKAAEAKVETVIFDRNTYRYHGRVKALADGAREAGLKF